MGRVIVINHITLDGVMQGPGRSDEDTRDGFAAGGWATARSDDAMGARMGELMGHGHSWLLGRRTYEDVLMSWNAQGGPFKDALNDPPKYVASSDPAFGLEWPNSTLLSGDVPAAVGSLREAEPGNLVIIGSGVLIRSLMTADLIDAYLLFIHPLVLGPGRRMFDGSVAGRLRMLDATTTETGVVIATYEPVRG